MKVIFTIDTLGNSGTEKSNLEIIRQFPKDIEVLVVYFFPVHELLQDYQQAGIRVKLINLEKKNIFLHGVKAFKEVLKEEKPDLVVSSLLRANLISRLACRSTGIPLVGTFVSDSYSPIRISSMPLKRKIGFYFYYLLDRFTAGIPIAWTSISNYISSSNAAKLKIPEAKITTIYRGRDASVFPVKSYVTSPKPFRFVFLGRLLQTKGVGELVRAFARVHEQDPEVKLHLIGDGNYRKKVEQFAVELGIHEQVIFHGRINNGWEKLSEFDCLIFPSWYEGFGCTLIEALMVGIPIISSNIPTSIEVLKGTESCLFHEVKNDQSLTDSLLKMMNNYEQVIVKAESDRLNAIAKYDIHQIAKEYEQFLRDCIKV